MQVGQHQQSAYLSSRLVTVQRLTEDPQPITAAIEMAWAVQRFRLRAFLVNRCAAPAAPPHANPLTPPRKCGSCVSSLLALPPLFPKPRTIEPTPSGYHVLGSMKQTAGPVDAPTWRRSARREAWRSLARRACTDCCATRRRA